MTHLPRLQDSVKITDETGLPTLVFQTWFQTLITAIDTALTDISQNVADILAAYRETARINSYTSPTNVLTGTDEAVGASITIAAHTRVYPVQGTIDVPDVVIPAPVTKTLLADGVTGILNSTQYSVYYDDTTLEDTTPDYKVVLTSTGQGTAQAGAAAGRHFVGVVTTPANGGGATTGDGSAPPGGGGGYPIP